MNKESWQQKKLQLLKGLNPAFFIQVPGYTEKVIAREQQYDGVDWEKSHRAAIGSNTRMSQLPFFFDHYENVIRARKGEVKLYDASCRELNDKETKEVHKNTVLDSRIWFDARFPRKAHDPAFYQKEAIQDFCMQQIIGLLGLQEYYSKHTASLH
jgi:hypothetical protein